VSACGGAPSPPPLTSCPASALPPCPQIGQIPFINRLLDTYCFTPEWTRSTLAALQAGTSSGQVLALHSTEDNVSDCRYALLPLPRIDTQLHTTYALVQSSQ